MELSFIFVAGGLFVLGIMVYVLFMVFLPEWVGITGKKALEAERSHQGDIVPANKTESVTAPEKDKK